MGWWFGRKSAPADVRPFVPAWLQSDAAEEGFARSYSAQVDEVYRCNPVGQRAVRLVAGLLGGLTVEAVDLSSTGSGQAARAAELVNSDGVLESIAATLLLHGNAYAQVPHQPAGRSSTKSRDLPSSRFLKRSVPTA